VIKVYSYTQCKCLEVPLPVAKFLTEVNRLGMESAIEKLGISIETLQQWSLDPTISMLIDERVEQQARANSLVRSYLASYLMKILDGTKIPSKFQIQAINAAEKLINPVFRSKQASISTNPEGGISKVEFVEEVVERNED
jgi:hypothetical protein